MPREKIIYIVSPSGAVGGGMGRVKDYIVASGGNSLARSRFEVLVTRDGRGAGYSLLLLVLAVLKIWWARLNGALALVHVNFGDKGSAFRKGLIILAARLVGARTILHLHAAELTDLYARSNGLVRFAIRQPFRAASSVIVLGRLWRDWLVRDLGIAPGKIDVLYNGVPVPVAKRVFDGAAPGPRQILFLGLLTERKGISDFLEALSSIDAGAPAWEAIVAGNGDIPGYEKKAQALGIGARTRFVGWVDQAGVRALLRSVDMMVLPSYNEGLPLVILEALGCGAPVICTPVGAIPEVLEGERNVLFVKPGDVASLGQTMTRLLADAALRQRLSDEGQACFLARFALPVFLANLFAIYARRFDIEIMLDAPAPTASAGATA
jgi:glycosyltransferase involved in cell wall biosynthesis